MGGLGTGAMSSQVAAVAGVCQAVAALQRLHAEWGQQEGGRWLAKAIDQELREPANSGFWVRCWWFSFHA